MKHTFGKQATRAGIALAVVAAFSALAIGSAQAQEFARANITLENAAKQQVASNVALGRRDLPPVDL